MPKVLDNPPALRVLREEANLDIPHAAEIVSKELGRTLTPEYLTLLEYRGTRLYEYIRAFSRAYGRSYDEVAEAAGINPKIILSK